MPERVHTRFDDDSVAEKPVQSIPAPAPTESKTQSKKRKRAERNGTSEVPAKKLNSQISKDKDSRPELPQTATALPEKQEPAANRRPNGRERQTYAQKRAQLEAVAQEKRERLQEQQPRNIPHKSLSEKSKELLKTRKELPIWNHRDRIRQCLGDAKNLMLLVGQTGSGKSTQVPQFLLNEPWCRGTIAITQPRRVAAVSLAKRVAEEMGTPLGSASPASKVGYSVRFDTSVSPSTKIKFLTEGMLLQEMLRDPSLRQYSAVVVDEVHERSVNVDLILGFLRNLINGDQKGRKGKPLKVVVMSATADVESLFNFFDPNPTSVSSVEDVDAGDKILEEKSNDEDSTKNLSNSTPKLPAELERLAKTSKSISICHIEGRQYPVRTTYLPIPVQDFVEEALKTIFRIHQREPLPGDILVFLTGQDTVEGLERLVIDYAAVMDTKLPKILTLPLFAAMPQAAQQKIFQPAPPKTRKVILSTNIAETSVTVPGVRYVIDSGKVKIKQFRNRLGLDSLLVKPVSQSSAIQRKGRAGREGPGQCHRLFTEKDYDALQKTTTPEILRCDLAQAIITMMSRGIDDVFNFPFLDKPPREAIEKAYFQLLELGALDGNGKINEVGQTIAKLPLTPSLGRVLVEAARPDKDCLLDVIDIVACLSVENIFLQVQIEEKKEEADLSRKELMKRDGDHLTMLATVKAYATERTDRKAWAEKYFISHRAMQNVMDIRKQLFSQCKQLKLLPESAALDDIDDTILSEARNERILQSLLSGFASNTARLMPDGSYKTLLGSQTVAIHPSSTLFGKKVEAILFSEFVFTNKSYAKSVSRVQLSWVDEVGR
ncbi:putative ATP-dependent RNA helicase [Venturia nashicola]|uniref:RNA helicase n=1 Tax=Venturia nashicola TaxID=86259 RepID=A0A4Z1P2V7_9PEZI|nr:putative ATP-dependent RNA helicase [Venturia nashicola]